MNEHIITMLDNNIKENSTYLEQNQKTRVDLLNSFDSLGFTEDLIVTCFVTKEPILIHAKALQEAINKTNYHITQNIASPLTVVTDTLVQECLGYGESVEETEFADEPTLKTQEEVCSEVASDTEEFNSLFEPAPVEPKDVEIEIVNPVEDQCECVDSCREVEKNEEELRKTQMSEKELETMVEEMEATFAKYKPYEVIE